MAVNIGTLSTVVTANAGPLTAGLQQGAQQVDSFARRVEQSGAIAQRAARGVAAFAGAVAGVFAIRRAISLISDLAAEIDALSKTARRFGVSVREVQVLSLVADKAGLSIDILERANSRLILAMESAEKSGSRQARALAELGVSAQQLASVDTSERMAILAQAFRGVESAADKTRIALTLFGRSGAEMVTLFEGGAAAFEDAARTIGEGIGNEQAQNIERARDAWTSMGTQIKTTVGSAFGAFVGWVENATEWIDRYRLGLDGVTFRTGAVADETQRFTEVGQDLIDSLKEKVDLFGMTSDEIAFYKAGLEGMTPAEASAAQSLLGRLEALREAEEAEKDAARASEERRREMERVAQQNEDAVASLEKEIATFGQTARQVGIYEAAMRGASDAQLEQMRIMDQQLTALEQQAEAMARMETEAKSLSDALRTPLESFEDEMQRLQELFNQGLIDEETLGRAVQRAVDQIAETELPVALRLPTATAAGSREEVALRTQGDIQRQQLERQKRIADAAQRQLEEMQAIRSAIEQQAEAEVGI